MDADVMAAMGISGFGKQPRKRQLDAARFDKAKREVRPRVSHELQGMLIVFSYHHHHPLKEGGRMPVHLVSRPIRHLPLVIPVLQTRVLMHRNPTLLYQNLNKRDFLLKSQSMTQMMTTATLVKLIFLSFP